MRIWLFLVLSLVLVACGTGGNAEAVEAPPAQRPVLDNAEWLSVYARPDEIVGRRVDLRARIYLDPEHDAAGYVFFGWVDFDNDQLSTAFVVPSAPEAVASGAYVRVAGVVEGTITRRDSQEREIVEPLVRVQRLLVTDRTGIRPALQVLQVDQALEQRGVRVILERVEFAEEETRIYFAVENRREELVSAFGTALVVRQGDAEHAAIITIGPGVPPPRGRVEPGATERGAFQFPPLSAKGPSFVVRWRGAWVEEIADQFQDWVWMVDPTGALQPEG